MQPTGQRIVAVAAGLITTVVLSMVTDLVMHGTGVFPPMGQPMANSLFLVALGYRLAFGVAGGYVTARLAPYEPLRHALILGSFGALIGFIGLITTWNRGPEFGPHWYPISLVVLAVPCACLGALLFGSRD